MLHVIGQICTFVCSSGLLLIDGNTPVVVERSVPVIDAGHDFSLDRLYHIQFRRFLLLVGIILVLLNGSILIILIHKCIFQLIIFGSRILFHFVHPTFIITSHVANLAELQDANLLLMRQIQMKMMFIELFTALCILIAYIISVSHFNEINLSNWLVFGQVYREIVEWLKTLVVGWCQRHWWSEHLEVEFHKASGLLLL